MIAVQDPYRINPNDNRKPSVSSTDTTHKSFKAGDYSQDIIMEMSQKRINNNI